jgi:hypothetical protein
MAKKDFIRPSCTISTQEGVEKGVVDDLPKSQFFSEIFDAVPSPAPLLEKVPEGRMRSLRWPYAIALRTRGGPLKRSLN